MALIQKKTSQIVIMQCKYIFGLSYIKQQNCFDTS